MFVIWRNFMTSLLICQYGNIFVGSLRVNPSTQPAPRIIDMMVGEELEIACEYRNHSIFYFDEFGFSLSQRNFSSEIEFTSKNDSKEVYKKSKVSSEDSGWYRCSKFDRFIYISVKSNIDYFLDDIVSPMPILIHNKQWKKFKVENDVWIPCKPTSPSYDVQVYKDGKPFDSLAGKIDLRKEYISVSEPGIYQCELKTDKGVVVTKEYTVKEEYDYPQPLIADKCHHSNNETKLRINCSIAHPNVPELYRSWKVTPMWTTSGATGMNFTSKEYPPIRHPTISNYLIMITELQIHSVSDNWMREFQCSFSAYGIPGSTKISVIVNRPDFQGINLITNSPSSSRIVKSVDREMQFVVAIEAYPNQPEIIWRDPRGREIVSNENKFLIENNCEETKLKVSNLDLEDDGYYTVEATTSNRGSNKTLIFNLDIWENRFIKTLDNVAEYYLQNDFAKVDCIVDESRELNITWSFRQRPDFPLNSTPENMIIGSDQTTVSWKVQSSGYISCTVCEFSEDVPNECENVTRPIFMTDVPGGFGIISPSRMMMINETVELICAASIYHFTDKVEWLDDSGIPLVVSDTLNLTETKSLLTFRAILTINRVQESDAKNYTCTATGINGERKMDSYKLNVHHPRDPKFVTTNMNQTEIDINIGISSPKEILLKCYVDGLPEPVISWWKDGVKLDPNRRENVGMCHLQLFNESQELHIEYLYEKCSGMYRCRAENRFKAEEIYQRITIHGIPEESTERIIELWNIFTILMAIMGLSVIVCLVLIIHCWISKRRLKKQFSKASSVHFEKSV